MASHAEVVTAAANAVANDTTTFNAAYDASRPNVSRDQAARYLREAIEQYPDVSRFRGLNPVEMAARFLAEHPDHFHAAWVAAGGRVLGTSNEREALSVLRSETGATGTTPPRVTAPVSDEDEDEGTFDLSDLAEYVSDIEVTVKFTLDADALSRA